MFNPILNFIDNLIEENNKFYNHGVRAFSNLSSAYSTGWALQNILRNTGHMRTAAKMGSGVKLLAAGTATTIAAGLALGLLSYAVYKAGKLIKKYRNKQLAEKHARRIHGQIKLIKMRKRRKI